MTKAARRSLVVAGIVGTSLAVLMVWNVSTRRAGWWFWAPERGMVVRRGAARRSAERLMPNLAPLAKVTVSSLQPAEPEAGSVADGVVDSREWSSGGQTRGAWIQLDWDTPIVAEEIDLFDRVSPQENVLGGALIFDDGSIIPVGPLPADGTPARIPLPRKVVNSVRFRIDAVEGTNPGLAEIMVRGAFKQ